ncbi:ABC transporter ATP-binding protein [Gemella haemolysans]|uniref:ABC transporter, ATP-binding protein n=1 Tax=Gemella haemolysans ATCC 10379 TaxID=546270 RepID=C5NXV3_9BACL|nr:ABC transporter ATP-binding protein [Gemella haemolysans]EER67619.1 ABC transporter, ATP-binding protein [Gemella haemolysans ATCC 10379]KAA8708874.1 ABC transporter ATP-binding protein [Gemella haemolysans]UBH82813.1 ABC transporter ATP-binding protein/permease [Gemella haemolysans]VEI38923.1 Putative multidrug export ATP-binding/permease protein SAV1866 [Gemella haemolysans]
MKLIKYLKGFLIPMIFLVAILGVRVVAELALPTYTSNIVDKGIQQSGIQDSVPEKISEKSFRELQLFMTDDEIKKVTAKYTKDGDVYKLDNINDQERSELNDIFKSAMTVVSGAKSENLDLDKVAEGVKLGLVKKDSLIEQKNKSISDLGSSADMITKQAGVRYVKEEYRNNVGIDTNEIRKNYLKEVGIMMIIVTFISGIGSVISNFIASRISSKIAYNLREKLYNKVLSFSKQDIDKFSTASLITRSTNDIQQIQNALNMMLFIAIYAPMMAVYGVYKVTQTDTGMTWIIALGVGILGLTLGIISFLVMPKFKIMQKLIDRVNLVTREALTGISVIRVFGREKYEEERFDKENTVLKNEQLFINRTLSALMPMIMLIMNGIALLIIWVGGKNIDAGSIQVGDMMAFITYTMQIVMSFLFFTFLMMQLPRAEVAAGRINEVLETEVTVVDSKHIDDSKLQDVKGTLKFDNVSFTFDGADSPVLSNISFEAEAGKTTAIIGSTGSGKSTLLHLIPRYFDASEGEISIDGVNIRDISLSKLRDTLGFVPQKGVLFSGNIKSNIKFADENITDEQMKKAAEIAQALDFINEKEDKFNSEISQDGSNVSGGQKQRLSIARALAKNPKILLFDDSFSALDYKTDVKLRKTLREEMSGVTTIIVAQRIATILNADKIIVMNEGKIVGVGKHQELLETCPTYLEIAESQLSEEELQKGGKHHV